MYKKTCDAADRACKQCGLRSKRGGCPDVGSTVDDDPLDLEPPDGLRVTSPEPNSIPHGETVVGDAVVISADVFDSSFSSAVRKEKNILGE